MHTKLTYIIIQLRTVCTFQRKLVVIIVHELSELPHFHLKSVK